MEKVIRKLKVSFVNLVDQEHHALVRLECLAQRAHVDVLADIPNVMVAKSAVVQPLHRVVVVEAFLRACCALHVPGDQLRTLTLCHGFSEQRFTRAGLSAHQQRLLQDQRTVDCSFQRRIREVRLGTRKFTARSRFDVGHHSSLKRRCHVLSIARCRRCCR